MNARVLVLVLDLAAAVFDAHVHAQKGFLLVFGKRIPQTAEGDRQVAGRLGDGIEVLMEHAVGRGENGAVPPVEALKVSIALVPVDAVAVSGYRKDVEVGPVTVRLLV